MPFDSSDVHEFTINGSLVGTFNSAGLALPSSSVLNVLRTSAPSSPASGDLWITSNGLFARVGSTTQTITAFTGGTLSSTLTLATGSTTVAPLKFVAGASTLSSPVAGAVEFDGTNLLVTNAGSQRKTVAFTDSNITGTAANVSGTVDIAHGGTGNTATPNAGTILIANSSGGYSQAFLTQGSGISITSASGSITIAATGGGGGGMSNPMATVGDMIVGGASGTPTRLGRGTSSSSGNVVSGLLSSGSTTPVWTDYLDLGWDSTAKRLGIGVLPSSVIHAAYNNASADGLTLQNSGGEAQISIQGSSASYGEVRLRAASGLNTTSYIEYKRGTLVFDKFSTAESSDATYQFSSRTTKFLTLIPNFMTYGNTAANGFTVRGTDAVAGTDTNTGTGAISILTGAPTGSGAGGNITLQSRFGGNSGTTANTAYGLLFSLESSVNKQFVFEKTDVNSDTIIPTNEGSLLMAAWDTNANTRIRVQNSSQGVSASAALSAQVDINGFGTTYRDLGLIAYGGGVTAAGAVQPVGGALYSNMSAGLSIVQTTAANISFYTGGTGAANLKMTLLSGGNLYLGSDTANPVAGITTTGEFISGKLRTVGYFFDAQTTGTAAYARLNSVNNSGIVQYAMTASSTNPSTALMRLYANDNGVITGVGRAGTMLFLNASNTGGMSFAVGTTPYFRFYTGSTTPGDANIRAVISAKGLSVGGYQGLTTVKSETAYTGVGFYPVAGTTYTVGVDDPDSDINASNLTVRAGKAGSGLLTLADANGGTLSLLAGSSTGRGTSSIVFQTAVGGAAGTTVNALATRLTIDYQGNIALGTGALTSASVGGFFFLPTLPLASGTPATPVNLAASPIYPYSGRSAMVFDTTGNKLWIYNPVAAAWKSVTLA